MENENHAPQHLLIKDEVFEKLKAAIKKLIDMQTTQETTQDTTQERFNKILSFNDDKEYLQFQADMIQQDIM